jgi:biotin carboxyl carrier protein
MEFKIIIDNKEHQVEAKADGTVMLDGETFAAKVSNSGADRRMVQVGDTTYEIRTVDNCTDSGIAVLELAGERIPMTVTGVTKGAGGSATTAATGAAPVAGSAAPAAVAPVTAPEEVKDGIWAPVPGKIVDVRVKVGDTVAEGDLVLILEAMKMENELHAAKKATVAAVLVKKGDQAERGQLLVAFE